MNSPKRWATLYISSLIAIGLILFGITFIVLAAAQLMLRSLEQRAGGRAIMNRASISRRRVATRCSCRCRRGAAGFGLIWLVLILYALADRMASAGLSLSALHRNHAAARRGAAACQCHRRQRDDERGRGGARNAHRHSGGHVSRRIWTLLVARLRRALRQRHSAQRAVDPDRPFHLRDHRACSMGHFSGLGGRGGAGGASSFRSWCARPKTCCCWFPTRLREAAASIGAPRASSIRAVTWRAARAGIVTGVLLAIARISGETAPLALHRAQQPVLEHRSERSRWRACRIVIFQFADVAL